MLTNRFGKDRYIPTGEWVQTTTVVKVVGIRYRKSNARRFMNAVEKAEKQGREYGLILEHQPSNPYDKNAIAVFGCVRVQRFFYKSSKKWQIGYLNRELAEELNEYLLSRGKHIAAELYEIWRGDQGFIDIKLIVLAPPGFGIHSRVRRNR